MRKEKTLVKKSKKPLIISIVVVILLIGGGFSLWYFVLRNREPEIVLTDLEYLASRSWEKEDDPTVIWSFHENGTGEITTNKLNYYDMKFSLEESSLKISTEWLYTLEDSFTIEIDRENSSFTVVNLLDEKTSKFVPLGTAEARAAEEAEANAEDVEPETPEE